MLNLQELQDSLDKALASETYESVMAWFKERDQEKAKQYIGVSGYLSSLKSIRDKNSTSEKPNNVQKETVVPSSDAYALAA